MVKKKTSITLSDEGLRLLVLLAEKYGISRTSFLEVFIRERAKAENVYGSEADSSLTPHSKAED